jgi:hypothetical protein
MAQKENDTCRESVSNGSPVFLWVEHLDPRDGIGFASAATRGIKGAGNPWCNLLDHVFKNPDDRPAPIPVDDPAKREGVKCRESFTSNTLHCYNLEYDGCKGTLAYNVIENDVNENQSMLTRPRFNIGCEEVSPNIYILSGHGAGGKISGEGNYIGEIEISSLTPFDSMNVLILPGCSIAGHGLAPMYNNLYASSNFYCILGYWNTYPGDAVSKKLMEDFVTLMRKGKPIIDAWISANTATSKRTGATFPWSAIYSESCRKHTISHIENRTQRKLDEYILFESSECPTPVKVMRSDYQSAFASISYKSDSDRTNFSDDLKSEIEEGESYFRTVRNCVINNKRYTTYWVIRNSKKALEPGQVLIIKMAVIRPNWDKQISFAKLFESIDTLNEAGYTISFPQTTSGNIIRIDIKKQIDSVVIPVLLKPGAGSEMKKLATHRDSNGRITQYNSAVICYLLECRTVNGELIINRSNSIFPPSGPKSNSWWRECLEVHDLTEFSCEFHG